MQKTGDHIIEMQPVERKPLTSYVMESIRELIIANDLQPGDALPPEGAISAQLGISRTAVREAVKILAALGIVDVKHGHGLFVKGFDFDALLDSLYYSLAVEGRHIVELLEVREGLEIVFVPSVVKNIMERDIQELQAIVDAMKAKSMRGEIFPDEDRQFHLILYRCTGNSLLLRLIRIFWLAFRQLRSAWLESGWEVDSVITAQDHVAILEALRSRDVDLLRQRIIDHYEPIRRQLAEKDLGTVGTEAAPKRAKHEVPRGAQ
jgi:DNA-binding FadR family transcriptional regulator